MAAKNREIAAIFEEITQLLQIEGANPFRIRAYRNAAMSLREMKEDISILYQRGEDLTTLPSIGPDLAKKIKEIIETGACATLEKLHKQFPSSLIELLNIAGLGPKKVKVLYEKLNIQTIDELSYAAQNGKLRTISGFGEKREIQVLEGIKARESMIKRFTIAEADRYVEPLLLYLKKIPGIIEVNSAGSYRRRKDTVGDLNFVATSKQSSSIVERFIHYDDVTDVISQEETYAQVMLQKTIEADLHIVPPEHYGAALHYYTGSLTHISAIKDKAHYKGLTLTEKGLFKGRKLLTTDSEISLFNKLGLPFILPELRENRGEVEASEADLLPEPIELNDLRGDLHCHTHQTDGHGSIKEMALAAQKRGLEYLAITDHSQSLTVAQGMNTHQLLKQIEDIDRINEKFEGITILKGIEVDILEDGNLDLPDFVLKRLDLVVGAIHRSFKLSKSKQTERILKALDSDCFTILAHPTGRLFGRRESYEVDMLRIIRKARSRGCFLELNSRPRRLDLTDEYCQIAREEGVLVSVNSDSHSIIDFDNLSYGIEQARRGWLEKNNVLNTRSLKELKPLIERTMVK